MIGLRSAPESAVNPHGIRAGWVRHLLGPFHVTGVVWFRIPVGVGRRLPLWLWFPAEIFATTVFFLLLLNVKRALARNLAVVLGPAGFFRRQLRSYRTLWEFAWVFGERYERMSHPDRFRIEVVNAHFWAETEKQGGVILATGHLGAWEMSTQTAAPTLARRVHVVREQELDPQSQAFQERLTKEFAHPDCVTHFATDDPRLGILLTHALRDGEVVALQADRPRAGSRTVPVDFFGRTVEFPAGPAVLARTSGAPLLPLFCFRDGRHAYRVVFREPIRVAQEGDRDEAVAEATRKLSAEVAWAIRQKPHQWFCFGPLWPE